MRKLFTITICLLWLGANSQNIRERLVKVHSIYEAKLFSEENPDLEAEIITPIPEIEDGEFSSKVLDVKSGDVFSDVNFTYKVLSIKQIQAFRVSYIFLDGNKLSSNEIEKIRFKILNEYKKGNSFASLSDKYTMDKNPNGGDLGWFSEGTMVPEFESTIKVYKKNDIFKVDVLHKKWFYVVFKTFNDKKVKELTVLKIKNI